MADGEDHVLADAEADQPAVLVENPSVRVPALSTHGLVGLPQPQAAERERLVTGEPGLGGVQAEGAA